MRLEGVLNQHVGFFVKLEDTANSSVAISERTCFQPFSPSFRDILVNGFAKGSRLVHVGSHENEGYLERLFVKSVD